MNKNSYTGINIKTNSRDYNEFLSNRISNALSKNVFANALPETIKKAPGLYQANYYWRVTAKTDDVRPRPQRHYNVGLQYNREITNQEQLPAESTPADLQEGFFNRTIRILKGLGK